MWSFVKSGVSTSSSGKAGTKEKPLVKERRGIQFDNVHAPYLASHMFQEALANQRLCDVSLIVKKSDMDDAEDDDALPESKVPLKAQASVQALEVETNAEDEDDSATLKFFGGRLVSKLGVDAPDDSKSICIGAHKVVLSLYSPVFDAMLNASQSLNSSANVKAKVHLRDTTVDTLKMVLEILYFDTWQLLMEAKNTNAVVSLLHFAQKYKVQKVRVVCEAHAVAMLSHESALTDILMYRSLPDMSDFGAAYIKKHADSIFLDPSFPTAPAEFVESFASDNTLTVKEYNVFNGLVKWVKRNAPENILGDAEALRAWGRRYVLHARLGTLNFKQVTEHVTNSGMLTSDEEMTLLTLVALPRAERSANKGSFPFSIMDREGCTRVPDSDIITVDNTEGFLKLLAKVGEDEPEGVRFELLWKMTKTNTNEWQRKSNVKCPTVVIAELNGGAIVGGYTTQAWDGSNQYKSDPKAFLWGISKNGQLYKSDPNPTNVRYSIYTGNNYAPTFGSGHDFQIQNNFQHVSANPGTFTQSAKGGFKTWSLSTISGGSTALKKLEIYALRPE